MEINVEIPLFMTLWDSELLCTCVFVFMHCVHCLLCIHCFSVAISLSFGSQKPPLVRYIVLRCHCSAVPYSISPLFLSFFTRSSQLNYIWWCAFVVLRMKSLHNFAICREDLVYRAHCTLHIRYGRRWFEENAANDICFLFLHYHLYCANDMKPCGYWVWSMRSHGPSWSGESKIYSLLNWIGV